MSNRSARAQLDIRYNELSERLLQKYAPNAKALDDPQFRQRVIDEIAKLLKSGGTAMQDELDLAFLRAANYQENSKKKGPPRTKKLTSKKAGAANSHDTATNEVRKTRPFSAPIQRSDGTASHETAAAEVPIRIGIYHLSTDNVKHNMVRHSNIRFNDGSDLDGKQHSGNKSISHSDYKALPTNPDLFEVMHRPKDDEFYKGSGAPQRKRIPITASTFKNSGSAAKEVFNDIFNPPGVPCSEAHASHKWDTKSFGNSNTVQRPMHTKLEYERGRTKLGMDSIPPSHTTTQKTAYQTPFGNNSNNKQSYKPATRDKDVHHSTHHFEFGNYEERSNGNNSRWLTTSKKDFKTFQFIDITDKTPNEIGSLHLENIQERTRGRRRDVTGDTTAQGESLY